MFFITDPGSPPSLHISPLKHEHMSNEHMILEYMQYMTFVQRFLSNILIFGCVEPAAERRENQSQLFDREKKVLLSQLALPIIQSKCFEWFTLF